MTLIANADWIENAPIREAVERALREGKTLSEIAEASGWTCTNGEGGRRPDTATLKRRIGMLANTNSRNPKYVQKAHLMSYENAVKVVRALGEFPVDYGL